MSKLLKLVIFLVTTLIYNSNAEFLNQGEVSENVEVVVKNNKSLKDLENFLSKTDEVTLEVKLKEEKEIILKSKKREIEKYLENGKNILPFVVKILIEHNLPKELAFIPVIESHYINGLKSPKGAAGIWQLMPTTARNLGLVVNNKVDERLDPVKSTLAAVKYLKNLYNTFGDWKLVLASYNAGHNKVVVKTSYHGNSFASIRKYLPKQTQDYVIKFLAIVEVAKSIMEEKKLHKTEPSYEIVKVKGGYKLDKIALSLYLPKEKLISLNPHFLKKEIPDDGKEYNLYVPQGYGRLADAILNNES
ncbi:lytic transglycosylase domain-containing protein [Sulfurihydrogenibium sp.]|uniref:lytic transglycosylase domain-containing protein n=1 Tax=Sulfurihydrogenibium sp. TaxID=2053621 RepID=UPI0026094D35|nr:lytic transglycosylase domain-containing protein [Sulfurihydrogenibium sp.]